MLEKRNEFGHPVQLQLQGYHPGPQKHHDERQQWNPYELNGGNIMAFAQDDFCVFAADTRLSRGYSILHRNTTKIHKLTKDTYILTAGMYADTINLWQILDREIEQFRLNHGKPMQSKSIACFLSRLLYSKRHFPFYTFNIIVGSELGQAFVWHFDAVGSYERTNFEAAGNGQGMMVTHIRQVFQEYNQIQKSPKKSAEEVRDIFYNIFQSVAERDTTTGDQLELFIMRLG